MNDNLFKKIEEKTKVDRETIIGIDKSLRIKSIKDIEITSEEICDVLNVGPSKIIREVYDVLKKEILDETLDNDNESIKEFIRKMW